jgi:hypothetical protein
MNMNSRFVNNLVRINNSTRINNLYKDINKKIKFYDSNINHKSNKDNSKSILCTHKMDSQSRTRNYVYDKNLL